MASLHVPSLNNNFVTEINEHNIQNNYGCFLEQKWLKIIVCPIDSLEELLINLLVEWGKSVLSCRDRHFFLHLNLSSMFSWSVPTFMTVEHIFYIQSNTVNLSSTFSTSVGSVVVKHSGTGFLICTRFTDLTNDLLTKNSLTISVLNNLSAFYAILCYPISIELYRKSL
jgi:hypothetical protein